MRRTFLAAAVAAGGVVFAACSDQRSPLPTEPPVSPNLTTSAPCPRPVELAALIVTLFAPRDLLTFALQMQNDINLKISRGDVAGARKVVLAFIDFTVKTYYQGKLRDPNGTTPPGTDVFAVKLIDGLLCWVGLPPSGLVLGPPNAASSPVTTKVIGPGGGDLQAKDAAGNGYAALRVDAGTVSADRLWVITRRDGLAPQGCVTTDLEQVGLCIDFSVVPAQDLAKPVTTVICQTNSNEGLQLAHQLPGGKVELLAFAADPFGLPCPHSFSPAPPGGLGSIGRTVWRFGSFIARVLGPKPVYAGHAGLGGLVAPKLSNITAVRVALGFVGQPTSTAPGAVITPAVKVAFLKFGTRVPEVDTAVTNPIRVAIGTDPSETATLSGTLTRNPISGVATFSDLSINKTGTGYTLEANALSPVATGSVPLGISAPSTPFDVTTTLVDCPGDPGGDEIDRGFYFPAFPATRLDRVTLHFSANVAGTYTFSLTARTGTYDGAVLGTATATTTLTADILANVPTTFTFSSPAVTQGSTVTFALANVSGPASAVAYYSVPGLGDPSCPIKQTNGTTPPLDTPRRQGVHVTIEGGAPISP